MRLAVISDIHGNMEAFLKTLADIDSAAVDQVVCLGDNIGYGPDPEEVVRLVRERRIPCVMGNHELSLVSPKYLEWFNALARQSLVLTRECLSESSMEYIRELPMNMVVGECLCVHGCPPDSAMTYIIELSTRELRARFEAMEQRICFVGHTHILGLYRFDGFHVHTESLGRDLVKLMPDNLYIVNVGGLGQPRDSNLDAKYVIYDDEAGTFEVRFVPYDSLTTANKILEKGWPRLHARRLHPM